MVTHAEMHVSEALMGLCEPLHEALRTAAIEVGAARLTLDLEDSMYNYAATHLIRARAHRLLGDSKLGEWNLSQRHGGNGPLRLNRGLMTLRMLHTTANQVPPPGNGKIRRAFYSNAPLFALGEQAMIPALSSSNYLGLWVVDAASYTPVIRVVRPIGPWKYGSSERVDVDLTLPELDEELLHLEFIPSDDDIVIEIPGEEEGEDGAGPVRR